MNFKEKVLLLFFRKPLETEVQGSTQELNLKNAAILLKRVFPDFEDSIMNNEILDFGCGEGYQACFLAKNGAKYVLGLDINDDFLNKARKMAKFLEVDNNVSFVNKLDVQSLQKFDMIISQNSMEHFNEPDKVLMQMEKTLKPNGQIFITFGPPWFAPYGSHMNFFIKIPWVNLLFDERTVMNIRALIRKDGAMKYEEIKGGLNKMSVAKFEKLVSQCNMKIIYKNYECVKRINFLGRIPLLRELFINHISCVLVKHKKKEDE